MLGVYSVLAFRVSYQTQEIGVRIALGAQREEVRAMVVREGLTLGAIGVAIGTVAALAGEFPNFILFKDTSGADRVAQSGLDLGGVFMVRGAEVGGYSRCEREHLHNQFGPEQQRR